MGELAHSICFDCGAPYTGPELVCSVCSRRAYRVGAVDSHDTELLRLRLMGSEQRKQRELKKYNDAVQAAIDAMMGS